MSPEMKSNFDILCAQIDKKFGKGTLMSLTAEAQTDPENVINTGSIGLNTALGVGGYPKGRIIEIFGPESSGKSTLCLQAVAQAQKKGKQCVYIDAEHSLDPLYAQNVGCDLSKLTICQPDYGEQALEVVNVLARSGEVGLIIVDSVAALTPKAELEGEITDSSIGVQARMMSKSMRMITGALNNTGCTVIFVNQIRHKIGISFGSPETTSGGNALKFYASQRLRISRTGDIKDGDKIIGNSTKVVVIKNKVAPPKRIAEFSIIYGRGIDKESELIDVAVEDGLLTKSGAWYKYEDNNIAQGKPNAIIWLNENEEIKEKLIKEVSELRGLI